METAQSDTDATQGTYFGRRSSYGEKRAAKAAVVVAKEIRRFQESPTLPEKKKAELIAGEVSKLAPIAGRFPGSPLVQNKLARAYLQAEDLKSGLSHAGRAVALARRGRDPALLADALASRSLAEWYAGDYPQAARDARESLKLRPDNPATIAVYYLSKGRGGPADRGPAGKAGDTARSGRVKELLDFASPLSDPEVIKYAKLYGAKKAAERLLQKAASASRLGDPKAVLEASGKALRFRPDSPDIYMMRGIALADLESLPAAMDELTIAIELWKERFKSEQDAARLKELAGLLATAFNIRSMLRERIKDYRGALEDAEEILRLDAGSAGAYLARAKAREGLGDGKPALADFKRAAELDPRREGDYQAALERLGAAGAGDSGADDGLSKARIPGVGRKAGMAAERPAWRVPGIVLAVVSGLVLLGAVIWVWLRVRNSGPQAQSGELAGRGPPAPVPAEPPPRPGGLAQGRYRLVRVIGEGGMGLVQEAYDAKLDRRVALKILSEKLKGDPRESARLIQEARTVAALNHEGIVGIHDVFEEDGRAYLVLELVEGKTLALVIRESGRIKPEDCLHPLKAVCSALGYAHGRGVLHRDIKPGNIMIGNGTVKVMDFGLARTTHSAEGRTQTSLVAGTPAYMAPEVYDGRVSRESDLYALGICLYEMLTGRLPFQGGLTLEDKLAGRFAAVSTFVPGAPGLHGFFQKALASKPENRFRGASELHAAFEKAVS